ncbi:MAG TPA: HAD family phosphatase [Nitrospirota bacterium]|nr:HAD family phosphatase [Nitrospirota bacterium]
MQNLITAVLVDFGGVLAEEGFLEGMRAIGRKNGLDPDEFFKTVDSLIYETGYLTGNADEAFFWNAVRKRTGIGGADHDLRAEILDRFVLRPDMLALMDSLRRRGIAVAMLSDQTNWLEEIDRSTSLFSHFDRVFNSYRMEKSKRDSSVFDYVCASLDVEPQKVLFVDDNISHIARARRRGLHTIHFVSREDCKNQLKNYFPGMTSVEILPGR